VTEPSRNTLLRTDELVLRFGGLVAVNEITLDVREQEILALIGPNGAGKTSLANCITGHYKPSAGRILLDGDDVTRARPTKMALRGVTRTYQNIELFHGMSVIDNLMLGRHLHMRSGILGGSLFLGRARREELENREVIEAIIDFLEIEHVRKTPVGLLPYGLQKRVDLGRALAMEPRLLILDEPMAGMNIEEKMDMARFILDTHAQRDITIILIEHDLGVVMDLSNRVAVLDFGHLITVGPPDDVSVDPEVIKAYIGEKGAARRARETAT
jgi:branched-chain amino acid transport system ATP-binding protein